MSRTGLHGHVTVRRGAYLPHWRLGGAIYHVVFRLADALPAEVLERYRTERAALLTEAPGGLTLRIAYALYSANGLIGFSIVGRGPAGWLGRGLRRLSSAQWSISKQAAIGFLRGA